ncbi:MAG: bifunctional NADH dehydrogenase FAD-containing subunit/selenide, water dikinase SelD, partial [Alphaproteobacteria bacterium]|nr:bifunctional NADH dehydrogenase FAD-containing subunit/selenide, water dikinase SelD [Alphaproteobacteria bacterium]
GGGHAQVAVLKSLVMAPIDGLRVTLISRDVMTPYSGMLPGYLEGAYSAEEISIDLSHLARACGARFIHGEVTAITPDDKTVTIAGRPAMAYDILSINTGSAPDVTAIAGAEDHA